MGTELGMLSTGLSALQAERQALEVTGQNIANANTDGYTRQRVMMQAVGGSVIPAMYSTSDGIGSGVDVSQVQRLQDAFLEQRANTENGTLSSLQGNQQTYTDIENAFGEPSDHGIQSLLSTFWNGWDDVANNPQDSAARTALIGDAQSLAVGLGVAANSLGAQWDSQNQTLASVVQQVNTIANNVASLNKAIVAASGAGNNPNDLMDQRDNLVRQLANMIGATAKANTDGSADVMINGATLVAGSDARQLTITGATAIDQVGTTPVALQWADNGLTLGVGSGQVSALLAGLNSTIPSYLTQLDGVATQLVTATNTQQAAGYDLNGNVGANFFDPTKTTAATIAVTLTDPNGVAASANPPTTDANGNTVVSLDGSNAQIMANYSGSTTGPDALYRAMIVKLGADAHSMEQKANTQQVVVQQVQAARDSVAGVDLDEEQTNLISYQQAYNAAAKYVSVLDGVLDTLINKMLV